MSKRNPGWHRRSTLCGARPRCRRRSPNRRSMANLTTSRLRMRVANLTTSHPRSGTLPASQSPALIPSSPASRRCFFRPSKADPHERGQAGRGLALRVSGLRYAGPRSTRDDCRCHEPVAARRGAEEPCFERAPRPATCLKRQCRNPSCRASRDQAAASMAQEARFRHLFWRYRSHRGKSGPFAEK